MLKIHQFFYDKDNNNIPSDNILGDQCVVYSLNIQACPGSKFKIGKGEIVIGNTGIFSLETQKHPIKNLSISNPIVDTYPLIIDIVYKGEVNTNVQ